MAHLTPCSSPHCASFVILRLLLIVALLANGWTPAMAHAHARDADTRVESTQDVASAAPCHGDATDMATAMPSESPMGEPIDADASDCCGPGEACSCECLHLSAAAMNVASIAGMPPGITRALPGDVEAGSWRQTPTLRPPIA